MANFTKKAIKEAFISLLEERPLGKITVKDVVEVCGITRNTFYYHYEDIPTLLQEIVIDQSEAIIAQYPNVDSIEACLRAALEFSLGYRKIILNIYNSVSRNVYEFYLMQTCEKLTTTYVDSLIGERKITEEDRTLLIRLHKASCYGIVMEWIDGGMRENILNDLQRLGKLMDGYAEELLSRCEKP